MNYKNQYEQRLKDVMNSKTVFSEIANTQTSEKASRTFVQRTKLFTSKIYSYLTRYQIVDTWTMHDNCSY